MSLVPVADVRLPVPGRRALAAIVLLLTLVALIASRSGLRPAPVSNLAASDASSLLHGVPLYFVENGDRFDPQVDFVVQGSDTTVYLTPDGITFLDRTEAVISRFKGPRSDWKTGIATWSRVIYEELWPSIDLELLAGHNQLKYQFVVHPGGDPRDIQLAYRGASSLEVADDGRLLVATPVKTLVDEPVFAYQEYWDERREIAATYAIDSGTESAGYGFAVAAFDQRKTLIIDPAVIIYAGYVGGVGSEFSVEIALDGDGGAYIVGRSRSSEATFPVAEGPDLTHNGSGDAFVAKINPVGTGLVYAGYIGGSGWDIAGGIAVDDGGSAYIAGYTGSSEATFPVTVGPDLIYNGGENDAFVAKVKPDGSGLVYSGYIGGSDADSASAIALDRGSNANIAGYTWSSEMTFPVVVGPDLTYNGAGNDAFIAKINPEGTGLVYAGYVGGDQFNFAYGIALDGGGNVYIVGRTDSTEATFPVGLGPDLTYNGGDNDGFVAKIRPDGTGLVYAGYLGGSGDDRGYGIAVDGGGNVYIAGNTSSSEANFPVAGGPDVIAATKRLKRRRSRIDREPEATRD